MNSTFINFGADPVSLLLRGEELLARFDDETHGESLVLSAFFLRMAIESRLLQYIEAAIPSAWRRESMRRITEFTAGRLLMRLTEFDSLAVEPATLVVSADDGLPPSAMAFVPMPRSLAVLHGKLGNLLHATYYYTAPGWNRNLRTTAGSFASLCNARDAIAEGYRELRVVVSGVLLAHPKFTEMVEQLEESWPHAGDAIA